MNTIYEECWAVHEALRKLNIRAEDIYIHVSPSTCDVVIEARQGPHSLGFRIGTVACEEFVVGWKAFVVKANVECALPENQEYYATILHRSHIYRDGGVTFVMHLVHNGFRFGPDVCVARTREEAPQ